MADNIQSNNAEISNLKPPPHNYPGLANALNHLFREKEDKELINVLVKNLNSSKSKGFFSLGFRVLWFGIRHPIHASNLMNIEKNKNAFSDPNFQAAVLQNPKTMTFMRSLGNNLPAIGNILAKYGVEEFKEGKILDQKGLEHLQKILQNEENLKLLQKVALSAIKDPLNPDEVVLNTLQLMIESKKDGDFFKEKGKGLKDYVVMAIQENPKLQGNLATYGLSKEDLKPLADIVPILLNEPEKLQTIYLKMNEGDYIGIVKVALTIAQDKPAEVKEYFKNNQELFSGVLDKMITESPELKEYNLSGKLYAIVPILLEHPDKLIKMVELYEEGKTTEVGKVFLDLAKSDEKIGNYLIQNNMMFNAVLNKAGFGAFEIDNKIVDFVGNLVNPQNLNKFSELIDLYDQGKWNDLIIKTCLLIEKDTEFRLFLIDNQENLGKLMNAAVSKMPEVQSYVGDADVGRLGSKIITDPTSIRLLAEGYKTGSKVALAMAGATFIKDKALDGEFRAAAYNAVSGWMFGSGVDKQGVVQKITDELGKRDVTQKINLTEFAKYTVDNSQIEDASQKTKLRQTVAQNNLFDGVSFIGKDKTLTLDNLEIKGNKFVNSKFDNVSFKDCEFTNVSFAGAKFSGGVDFRGSEIDGTTLQSLLPALKEGTVSLNEVKIVGDLPTGIDLTDINLKGADLSKVTSLKHANLSGTYLAGAILPDNKEMLSGAHNLKDAILDQGVLTETMKANQENTVIERVMANFKDLSPEQKNLSPEKKASLEAKSKNLEATLRDLYRDDTKVGEEFRKTIEANPTELTNSNLPLDTGQYSHVADYRGRTANMLDVIYHNRENPTNIANNITANIIADEVIKGLFDEGNNRGQDGQAIRRMVTTSLENIIKDNPEITSKTILESENFKNMIHSMTEELRLETSYTLAGKLTGGIQLKAEVENDSLTAKLTTHIKEAVKFSKDEVEQIQAIAEGIGKNIYGSRKEDYNLVLAGVKDMVYEIKTEHGGVDISALLENKRDKIIGTVEVDKGYFYNSYSYTGLTKVYQAASPNTTAGAITGGVMLDDTTHKNPGLLTQIKEEIFAAIKEKLKLKMDNLSKNSAEVPKNDLSKSEKGSNLKGMVQNINIPTDQHVAKGDKVSNKTNLPNQQRKEGKVGIQ